MTYISNGYTIAFAITAPVAPARALPHGGNGGNPVLFAMGKSARNGRAGVDIRLSMFG